MGGSKRGGGVHDTRHSSTYLAPAGSPLGPALSPMVHAHQSDAAPSGTPVRRTIRVGCWRGRE